MIYIIIAVIAFTAIFIYNNNYLRTENIIVASEKIPKNFDGYEILHLSDLHNVSYGKRNRRLCQAVNQMNVDAILYTGDMVDERNFSKRGFYHLLEGIKNKIPSYFIFGNHEDGLDGSQKEELLHKLGEEGITVLRNNQVILKRDGDVIYLHGLDVGRQYLRNTYNHDGTLQLTCQDIQSKLGRPNGGFHILLAHNPLYGQAYEAAGFDLTFSGHVHGGMIRVPCLGGVMSPDRSFFPKYSKGKYDINGSTLIVSPGIGGHKARIGNPLSIYKITLKSQPS